MALRCPVQQLALACLACFLAFLLSSTSRLRTTAAALQKQKREICEMLVGAAWLCGSETADVRRDWLLDSQRCWLVGITSAGVPCGCQDSSLSGYKLQSEESVYGIICQPTWLGHSDRKCSATCGKSRGRI